MRVRYIKLSVSKIELPLFANRPSTATHVCLRLLSSLWGVIDTRQLFYIIFSVTSVLI